MPFRKTWLAPLLVAASGLAGYLLASSNPDSEARETPPPLDGRPEHQRVRSGASAEAAFDDLLSNGGRETDVWRVVSRLPDAKLEEYRLRVRDQLASAPTDSPEAARLADIESALYFRWAEIDPEAALADVSAIPKSLDHEIDARRDTLLHSVLAAWMRTEPDAAYRAVKDHEDFGYIGRNMLVQTWTPENVFENAARYPDKHRDLLGWYCVAAAKNEEHRNAMLAAIAERPDMKDGDWAKFLLFRSWGYSDFTAAVEAAQGFGYQDRVEQIVQDNLQSNPHLALPWAAANGFESGGGRWENGFRFWLQFGPDQARAWLAEQTPAWTSQGRHRAVTGLVAQDYLATKKAGDAAPTGDAARRTTEAFANWRATDPKAAGNWLDTAPEPVRELIRGEGGNDHE